MKECEQLYVLCQNVQLPVELVCDTFPHGIGSAMSHVIKDGNEFPITFACCLLKAVENNYAPIAKEILGLVWGVECFNQCLCGREFAHLTDHQPLLSLSIFNPRKEFCLEQLLK